MLHLIIDQARITRTSFELLFQALTVINFVDDTISDELIGLLLIQHFDAEQSGRKATRPRW